MAYLIIAAAVLLIISSIFWFRPTRRQKQLEVLRRSARIGGLQVRLAKRPDALPDERYLDSVLYFLPWSRPMDRIHPKASRWVLVRNPRRGEPSPWEGWRWLSGPGPESLYPAIAAALPGIPASSQAVAASSVGVGVYWDERIEQADDPIPGLAEALTSLRSAAEAVPRPERVT